MKDLNCVVNFSPSIYVFQDQILGRTIDSAKEFEGLYYFKKTFPCVVKFKPLCAILPQENKK